MSDLSVFNIIDMLKERGEDEVKQILSEFSCPKNDEIYNFLTKNAIEFAKKKMSITYLVFDEQKRFLGYFTLAHKNVMIPDDKIESNTSKNKLLRYARPDEKTHCYDISAFLIAQFGKNFAVDDGGSISGNELMDSTFKILLEAQKIIGGGVVFLECEEKDKLLEFYTNDKNRFIQYGERWSESDSKKYLQLLRIF